MVVVSISKGTFAGSSVEFTTPACAGATSAASSDDGTDSGGIDTCALCGSIASDDAAEPVTSVLGCPVTSPFESPSPSTISAAAANSGSTRVRVTSANPVGGRFSVPLKMQSAMRSARSDLWLCSPSTQEIASTILDLPQPFGPMMQLSPVPLNVRWVFSQNDLNPTNSTLRSLSKVTPFVILSRPRQRANKDVERYVFHYLWRRG